jgi:putative hemolysin
LLPKELLKKRFKRINVKIGSAIPYKWLAAIENDKDLTAYLRFRTYMLGNAFSKFPAFFNTPMKNWKKHKNPEPIVAPADPQDLALEVEKLGQDQLMGQSGDLQVYTAYPKQIPKILYEIGRLREETFRLVGEGTGKSLDLDRFDDDNIHLFVWNAEKREVVGAYRLAQSDEIERKYGRKGFYTYTLFKYQDRLLRQIGPGLELSRSFVRPEYQRNYAPLLLLWKGLGQFVVHHPKYKVLFGAVSITNAYNSYSRNLMAAFLKSNNFVDELSQLVRPRKPYRQKRIKGLNRKNPEFWPGDIEELSNWISGIETDGKGIPILLKQYLKLGGKLLSFNIDPSFGNVLDGLIMVDLTCTDPKVLRRYMGPEGFETFISYHLGSGSEFPLGKSMPANACANPY